MMSMTKNGLCEQRLSVHSVDFHVSTARTRSCLVDTKKVSWVDGDVIRARAELRWRQQRETAAAERRVQAENDLQRLRLKAIQDDRRRRGHSPASSSEDSDRSCLEWPSTPSVKAFPLSSPFDVAEDFGADVGRAIPGTENIVESWNKTRNANQLPQWPFAQPVPRVTGCSWNSALWLQGWGSTLPQHQNAPPTNGSSSSRAPPDADAGSGEMTWRRGKAPGTGKTEKTPLHYNWLISLQWQVVFSSLILPNR